MNPTLDGFCTSTTIPSSIISLSSANSHLAATLAGFVIAGITFLLAKGENTPSPVVALFASGFLVLSIDSFMFGTISAPPVDKNGAIKAGGDYLCSLAWSQGTVASGMLAVGAASLATGLAWMFANHIELLRENPKWLNERWLVQFGNFLIITVVAACTALLARTSMDYFDMLGDYFGLVAPSWVTHHNVYGAAIVCIAICVATIIARTRGFAVAKNREVFLVRVATFLTASLAFAGPFFASVTASYARSRPADQNTAVCALILGLFVPVIVFLALSISSPLLIRAPKPGPTASPAKSTEDVQAQ
jgi:hypothetical protein